MKVKTYRYPNCVICVALKELEERKKISKAPLFEKGIGPVCRSHYNAPYSKSVIDAIKGVPT